MSKEKNKQVISEEIAVKEVHEFITKFAKKPESIEEIKDAYPNIVDYVCNGLLIFDDSKVPTLKLMHPIKNTDNEVSISEISFKTRVKPTVKADLADGLNLEKQAPKYALRLISFIISQPVAMLDNFSTEDYDVINELAAVFTVGGR